MKSSNLRRRIFVAACGAVIFGLLVSRAVAGGNPVQIHLDHWQNGCTPKNSKTTCPDTAEKWVDGNLHNTNSTYVEGDTVPTRYVMENLTTGRSYTLTFSWLAAKSQKYVKHAHDYMRTYDASYVAGGGSPGAQGGSPTEPFAIYPDPCLALVQGGGKGGPICSGLPVPTNNGSFLMVPNPDLKMVPGGFTGAQATGDFKMWNGTMTAIVVPLGNTNSGYVYNPDPPFSGTTSNQLAFTFTANGGTVVLALGAHLAKDGEWASPPSNNGAAGINGAPYHWEYSLVDNATNPPTRVAGGNRDRSIMVETNNAGAITVKKKCFVGDPTDPTNEVFPNVLFPFTGSGASDLSSSFDVACGESHGFVLSNGTTTITLTELAAASPADPSSGWELRTISCVQTGTTTAPGSYSTSFSASPGRRPGSSTFQYKPGDDITCTFTNVQAEMPVRKTISGRTPTCTGDPATNPNNPPGGVVIDPNTNQPAPGPPCSDAVVGGPLPLFQANLYPDADPFNPVGQPFGFPSDTTFGTPLATIFIPPLADPPAPIGVPFTICEVNIPNGWYLPDTGVTITASPTPVGSPTVYTPAASSTAHVTGAVIVSGGTAGAYAVNDILTVVGGTGVAATLKVTSVSAGVITGIIVQTGGSYTVNPTNPVSVTGGGGTGATFNLTLSATGDRNRCFDVLIPTGTNQFEIFVNNLPVGTITVIKNTVGGDGTFNFTGSGTTGSDCDNGGTICTGLPASFSLTTSPPTHTAQVSYTVAARTVFPNTAGLDPYGVSETGVGTGTLNDWDRSASCVGGTPGTNGNFGVAPGGTVTCTFTNKKKPKLTVQKRVVPWLDTGSFNLQIDGTVNQLTVTGPGNSTTGIISPALSAVISLASTTSHTVGETEVTGTPLSNYTSSISCTNGASGSGTSLTLTLAYGVDVTCTITNFRNACSYTQGGWGSTPNGGNPGAILAANFPILYPLPPNLVVGSPYPTNFYMQFTSAAAVEAYLPMGTTPGVLIGSVTNPPTEALNAGVFGSQVLALQLNVDFSNATNLVNPKPPFQSPLGNFTLTNTGTTLDGLSISQVLGVANTVLGGNSILGFSAANVSTLNFWVDSINNGFDNCTLNPAFAPYIR